MGSAQLEVVRSDHDAPRRPGAPNATSPRVRIVGGALRCIAGRGMAKTTLDDVARAAGCSRATVYRTFPGGKDAVMAAVVDTEVARLFSELAVRMGRASDLEEVIVAGMSGAATRIVAHGALGLLLEHEPEVVLPHLAFEHHDAVLSAASKFTAPFLGRWLSHEEAARVAEWSTRIVLSYLACPADGVDLTDPDSVRRLVRTYVLPGIRALPPEADSPVRAAEDSEDSEHPSLRLVRSHGRVATSKGEAS
ncbi:MAG: TetR/AcrR family transcriptional regulator [Acidimicrobiales bacterium]